MSCRQCEDGPLESLPSSLRAHILQSPPPDQERNADSERGQSDQPAHDPASRPGIRKEEENRREEGGDEQPPDEDRPSERARDRSPDARRLARELDGGCDEGGARAAAGGAIADDSPKNDGGILTTTGASGGGLGFHVARIVRLDVVTSNVLEDEAFSARRPVVSPAGEPHFGGADANVSPWRCPVLCEDVMENEVDVLSRKDTVERAAAIMRESDIGFLPICDEENRPVGVITDRDIVLRVIAERRPLTTPVEQVMTRHVVTCSPFDEIAEAHRLMAEHQVSRIVCVNGGGHAVGVISLADLSDVDEQETGETLQEVKAPGAIR